MLMYTHAFPLLFIYIHPIKQNLPSMLLLCPLRVHSTFYKPSDLLPLRIEITVCQPRFESSLDALPLAIQHAKPRRIPIPPLNNHMLPKHALKCKAISLRRPLTGRVQVITFPFTPPVAQAIEDLLQ